MGTQLRRAVPGKELAQAARLRGLCPPVGLGARWRAKSPPHRTEVLRTERRNQGCSSVSGKAIAGPGFARGHWAGAGFGGDEQARALRRIPSDIASTRFAGGRRSVGAVGVRGGDGAPPSTDQRRYPVCFFPSWAKRVLVGAQWLRLLCAFVSCLPDLGVELHPWRLTAARRAGRCRRRSRRRRDRSRRVSGTRTGSWRSR